MLRYRRWPMSAIEKHLWTLKAITCEFVGAMLINILTFTFSFETQSYFTVALIYGAVNAALVHGIGPISGGHLNPAVTIGLWIIGRITSYLALLYVTSQCLGGIVGSLILNFLLAEPEAPPSTTTPSTTSVADTEPIAINGTTIFELFLTEVTVNREPIILWDGVSVIQGFLVEFLATFLLLLAICGAHQGGFPGTAPVIPVTIFFATTAGHLFAAGFTGAGLNPARVLGNSQRFHISDHFHVVYWSGTILGGICGTCISRDVILPRNVPRQSDWAAT